MRFTTNLYYVNSPELLLDPIKNSIIMSYSKVRNMDKTLQKKKGKLVVRHLANAKGGC